MIVQYNPCETCSSSVGQLWHFLGEHAPIFVGVTQQTHPIADNSDFIFHLEIG